VQYKHRVCHFLNIFSQIGPVKSKAPTGQIVESKSKSSLADDIRKLAELHQSGLIDDTEFKELKAKLIQD
jgi:hypothetical protein